MKYLCFVVILYLLSFSQATAQAGVGQGPKPVFFEALYDVPAMPGLVEAKDQTMVFDKPDGKIATVTAFSKSVKGGQISSFYADVLPQFGWKKITENQYVRDRERLILTITDKQGGVVVQFTLSPAL